MCTHKHTHVYMHASTYICMDTHMHTYINKHMHGHVTHRHNTHTHTHTTCHSVQYTDTSALTKWLMRKWRTSEDINETLFGPASTMNKTRPQASAFSPSAVFILFSAIWISYLLPWASQSIWFTSAKLVRWNCSVTVEGR